VKPVGVASRVGVNLHKQVVLVEGYEVNAVQVSALEVLVKIQDARFVNFSWEDGFQFLWHVIKNVLGCFKTGVAFLWITNQEVDVVTSVGEGLWSVTIIYQILEVILPMLRFYRLLRCHRNVVWVEPKAFLNGFVFLNLFLHLLSVSTLSIRIFQWLGPWHLAVDTSLRFLVLFILNLFLHMDSYLPDLFLPPLWGLTSVREHLSVHYRFCLEFVDQFSLLSLSFQQLFL